MNRSITRDVHDWLHEHHAPGDEVGTARDVWTHLPWYNLNQVSAALSRLEKIGVVEVERSPKTWIRNRYTWKRTAVGVAWSKGTAGYQHTKTRAPRVRPLDLSPYVGGEAPLTLEEERLAAVRATLEAQLDQIARLEELLS